MVSYPDFQPAPNQGARPDLYELENRAMDPDHLVLDAMRELAPWAGKTLLDLGCGSGYWLPGSAEHIPLPDASVDVVHARFAYFFATPEITFSPDAAPSWSAGAHRRFRNKK